MHKFILGDWIESFINDLSYALFGACAGSVAYLTGVADGTYSFMWYKFSIGLFANGFSSVLAAKICDALDVPEPWKIVAVGMAGALGYNSTIMIARKYLFKKFGLDRRMEK
jgi:hypothetical protein